MPCGEGEANKWPETRWGMGKGACLTVTAWYSRKQAKRFPGTEYSLLFEDGGT